MHLCILKDEVCCEIRSPLCDKCIFKIQRNLLFAQGKSLKYFVIDSENDWLHTKSVEKSKTLFSPNTFSKERRERNPIFYCTWLCFNSLERTEPYFLVSSILFQSWNDKYFVCASMIMTNLYTHFVHCWLYSEKQICVTPSVTVTPVTPGCWGLYEVFTPWPLTSEVLTELWNTAGF